MFEPSSKVRMDVWTKEEDELLTKTLLEYVENGFTQNRAFEAVSKKINRTSAACGFRWHSSLKNKYEKEFNEAKKKGLLTKYKEERFEDIIRKIQEKKQRVPVFQEIKNQENKEALRLIEAWESVKKIVDEKIIEKFEVTNDKMKQLEEENIQLKRKIKKMQEDYQVIVNILNKT